MSRRVFIFGLGIALVSLAFAVNDWIFSGPGVTQANVWRIQEGMTYAEVAAILGGEANGMLYIGGGMGPFLGTWEGPEGTAQVMFRRGWRVIVVDWGTRQRPPNTLDQIKSWLGWHCAAARTANVHEQYLAYKKKLAEAIR